jgi:hypothetical protein
LAVFSRGKIDRFSFGFSYTDLYGFERKHPGFTSEALHISLIKKKGKSDFRKSSKITPEI